MAETLWCEPDRAKWVGVRPGLYGETIYKTSVVSNSNYVLYTVPTGKTLVLKNVSMTVNIFVGSDALCYINDLTPVTVYRFYRIYAAIAPGLYILEWHSTYGMELPAGYTIQVFSGSANMQASVSIYGVLVDNTLMGN